MARSNVRRFRFTDRWCFESSGSWTTSSIYSSEGGLRVFAQCSGRQRKETEEFSSIKEPSVCRASTGRLRNTTSSLLRGQSLQSNCTIFPDRFKNNVCIIRGVKYSWPMKELVVCVTRRSEQGGKHLQSYFVFFFTSLTVNAASHLFLFFQCLCILPHGRNTPLLLLQEPYLPPKQWAHDPPG